MVLRHNVPEQWLGGHPAIRTVCGEQSLAILFTCGETHHPAGVAFEPIPNQKADVPEIPMTAATDAGLPVQFYVKAGPAVAEGSTLRLAEVSVRAKGRINVTVVAWQWGRAVAPDVQTAEPVDRNSRS